MKKIILILLFILCITITSCGDKANKIDNFPDKSKIEENFSNTYHLRISHNVAEFEVIRNGNILYYSTSENSGELFDMENLTAFEIDNSSSKKYKIDYNELYVKKILEMVSKYISFHLSFDSVELTQLSDKTILNRVANGYSLTLKEKGPETIHEMYIDKELGFCLSYNQRIVSLGKDIVSINFKYLTFDSEVINNTLDEFNNYQLDYKPTIHKFWPKIDLTSGVPKFTNGTFTSAISDNTSCDIFISEVVLNNFSTYVDELISNGFTGEVKTDGAGKKIFTGSNTTKKIIVEFINNEIVIKIAYV